MYFDGMKSIKRNVYMFHVFRTLIIVNECLILFYILCVHCSMNPQWGGGIDSKTNSSDTQFNPFAAGGQF